tara:strand:+ start:341 stop:574 length:234 start_codon:yes stop_codon:yes gene_type:complete
MEECCQECSYWEDRADINTENEVKMKVKKIEESILVIPKLHNPKSVSGINKADRDGNVEGFFRSVIRKSRGWLKSPQ